MGDKKSEVLQGTLDLMVLKTLQERSAKPRSIFSCERGSDCVHKSPVPRGLRHQYSRKLRCPWSY
jgi:hypothetical protein